MRPSRETTRNNDAAYFVSTQTAGRKPFFRHERWARLMLDVLKHYDGTGYTLHAFVIMPDHLHVLITPSESVEKSVQLFKGGFSFRLKSKMDVWMRSFNESQIMTPDKFADCVRYVEENPVRARLVSRADEYSFSSAGEAGLDPMPAHFRD